MSSSQHLLIARSGARLVALRMDRALDLVAVLAEVVQPAADVAPGVDGLAGIAKGPDGVRFLFTTGYSPGTSHVEPLNSLPGRVLTKVVRDQGTRARGAAGAG